MRYDFQYKDHEYHVEDVSVKRIAESVGTPCYVYSRSALDGYFEVFRDALKELDPIICYSVKANSNLAVLKTYSKLGSGFDIVSGGELYRVLKVGGDPQKVVFSGVGKTEGEIKEAIEADILFFNVESSDELAKLNETAKSLGKRARIAIRVNPDIDPKTHPYISTGLKKSKFGIDINTAFEVYKKAASMESIEVVGVDAHIGSQIFDLNPFAQSMRKLVAFADRLAEMGIPVKYIDIGGGLGINYREDDNPPHPKEYAEVIKKEMEGKPYKIVLEPGRALVGNAGALITKVLYIKEGETKKFIIIDAGMNDLIRPAFYDAYHNILTADESFGDVETVDVVGPVCETVDVLGKDVELPYLKPGDLLVIQSAGAYGFVMASNYNSRTRPAEVMVEGGGFSVIKERETYEDLIEGEIIPDFLKSR